jgi:hypothetical protein
MTPRRRISSARATDQTLLDVEVLDLVLDLGHELVARRTVDEPVVVPQREIRHRPDRYRLVDDDRTLFDRADAEDRHLRLVDDRHPELRAELPWIRDREGAALDVIRFQLLRARALGKVGDRAAEAEQVLLVGLFDHGNDEAAFKRHCDADVDVLAVDDVVAVERGIDDGKAPQRGDHGLGNERHIRQLRPTLLVLGFLLLANALDGREVHVEDRVHMGGGPPAHDHVLGDLLAHDRQRLYAVARSNRNRDSPLDVARGRPERETKGGNQESGLGQVVGIQALRIQDRAARVRRLIPPDS